MLIGTIVKWAVLFYSCKYKIILFDVLRFVREHFHKRKKRLIGTLEINRRSLAGKKKWIITNERGKS